MKWLSIARQHPWQTLGVVAVALMIAAGTGSATYALWIQPDPQILTLPLAHQTDKDAAPIPNAGVDANGLTLDQWIARGNAPNTYRPLRKTVFRAGESLWVLRYNCFISKTQEGLVSRAFLGGDGSAGTNVSVYALPDVQIPTRTDGCAVKNHRTPIPPDLPPGTWRYAATANFYKSPVQPSVRIHFAQVQIEVVK